MKKLLVTLGFLVLANLAQAKDAGCRESIISFQNESSNDCVLKEQKILYGTMLIKHSQIPDVLFRGQSVQFTMTQDRDRNGTTMIYLKYQCGNDQDITLLSHTSYDNRVSDGSTRPIAEGFVLDKNNMNASFTKKNPTMCVLWNETSPAKINWILTDNQ